MPKIPSLSSKELVRLLEKGGASFVRQGSTDHAIYSRIVVGKRMKNVSLSEVKDHLSEYLDLAEKEEVIITRHGKPAGVLIGFASEDDWFDYRLENDPRFLERITAARKNLREGKGVQLEDLPE